MASRMPVEDIKLADYPTIPSVYSGSNQQRIVVFGQIWSLVDFAGSTVLVTLGSESMLAAFRYEKR